MARYKVYITDYEKLTAYEYDADAVFVNTAEYGTGGAVGTILSKDADIAEVSAWLCAVQKQMDNYLEKHPDIGKMVKVLELLKAFDTEIEDLLEDNDELEL